MSSPTASPVVGSRSSGSLTVEPEREVVVTRKVRVADDIVLLELSLPDGTELPPWQAGSHVDLVMPNGVARQYSLTGDPARPGSWQVAVLREPDGRGGSMWVHDDVHEGSRILVRGPRNHFALEDAPAYHFVAGGIGVTPIMAMAHEATAAGVPWTMTYCGRERNRMALLDELTELAGDRAEVYPSTERGRADLTAIVDNLAPGTHVYVCGPAALTESLEEACRRAGLPPARSETFVPPQVDTSHDTGFAVEIASTGEVIDVPAHCTILEALKSAGVPTLASCEEGTCGTCETGVLSGTPEHRDAVLTDEEREQNDYMLICISRSRSPKLVLDL